MNMKAQEQKIRLLNHLSSQLEQIIDFLPQLKGKHDAQTYKSIHTIAAKIKTFTAKNQNSNLYRIFNRIEEQIYRLSKYKDTTPPQEVAHFEKLIALAKEQLGLIYKSLILESNVNGLVTHADLDSRLDQQISCLDKGNGYLKISYGGQDISMFSKDKNALLNQWYEELTPIDKNGNTSGRRDAFVKSFGDLIDVKNSSLDGNTEVYHTIEELCSRFEKLQSVELKPLIENILVRIKSLSTEIEKPLEVDLNVDEVNIPENLLEPVVNFFNSLFELVVLNALESKELRASCGKSLPYKLKVRIINNEFNLKVLVTDDGKGKELLGALDSIKNNKAGLLKSIMQKNEINFNETNYLGRESIYEFEIPMEPWFFKAYLINSNSREYFIPLSQVKSFIKLSNDYVVDSSYLYADKKMRYFHAGGRTPKDLSNKIGIIHYNEQGAVQLLVCNSVSEPTYIKIQERKGKESHFVGTCKWKEDKIISIFDVRKLCQTQNENVLGIV